MAGAILREKGWHLSDECLEQFKQNGKEDVDSVIKVALDTDLREVGSGWLPEDISRGRADYVEGPGIVQLQKLRNVSAPKDNEDSQAAPRLMKLSLTDGQNTCSAIETEILRDISLNTPPGVKIKLKSTIDIEHGFLLLNNKNTQVLGGRVEKLVETWELKKKLAHQSRIISSSSDGGPPPFVQFGHKIDNSQIKTPRRDNFKSLESNKVEKKKEDDEFEQQRKATIAEAMQAKEDGMTKKFGGQKQATSDHDIARITEMGFRADEAGTALRMHNGNVQHAIDYLLTRKKPGGPNRQSSYEGDRGDRGRGRRDRRDDDSGPPGRGRRRGGDSEDTGEGVPSRPSGPATLFDFLETKFPANESKGSGKEDKDSSSQSGSTNKYSDRNNQSSYNESRDRPRSSAHNVNPDTSYNQQNRPKPQPQQQNIPPRFVNKSKQDSGQNYNKGPQGRYRDDRSDRSRDDRPRTAPSDRNYDNRNYNDRNYSDRNYNDRNINDRDRNRGYNDRRNNDYGDSRGNRDNRDTRGDRGQSYNRNNNTNNNNNNNNNSSSGSSDNSQRNNNNKSASAKSNPPEKKGPRDNKENQETVPNENKKSNRTQAEVSSGDAKSRNFQKGQNEKSEQSSTVKTGGNTNRQDNYSRAGNVPPQTTYRNDRPQANNHHQGYVPNGNYGNPAPQRLSYGGPPVATSGGYMYPEAQMLPFGLKPGDKVMAKYWEDGGFYEAVIDYYAPNLPTCMVIFVDYGNCEEVRLSDIRPILPQMPMGQHPGPMMQPDMSIPPPGVFFSAPPPTMPSGMQDSHNAISSMEFRRGGGGAAYQRKEGRPAQQLYQPPSQRR